MFGFKFQNMPFWLLNHNCYHDDIKHQIDCKVTRKAHEKAETAIKGERLFSYHLVVLKSGILLNNSIFSNYNINVKRYQLSMRMDANDRDNNFEKKLYGMAVWWKIAEAGGTRIRNAETNKSSPRVYWTSDTLNFDTIKQLNYPHTHVSTRWSGVVNSFPLCVPAKRKLPSCNSCL
jgi:hypothetical protein